MIRTKQKAPVKRRGRRDVHVVHAEIGKPLEDVSKPLAEGKMIVMTGPAGGGGRVGRPPSGKIMVNLRLDPDVVAKFKADGPGWQARMNEALRQARPLIKWADVRDKDTID